MHTIQPIQCLAIQISALLLFMMPCMGAESYPFYRMADLPEKQAAGQTNVLPECRPTKDDPDGHWSPIQFGGQLGLRLTTNTFVAGQPIEARIFIRNTSDAPIKISRSRGIPMGVAKFAVTDPQGNELPSRLKKEDYLHLARPVISSLAPGFQREYRERMDTSFDFSKPGEYQIVAEYWFLPRSAAEGTEPKTVFSGKARITIVPPDPRPPDSK